MRASLFALTVLGLLASCKARGPGRESAASSSPSASASHRFDGSHESSLTEEAVRLFEAQDPGIVATVVGPLALEIAARGSDKPGMRVTLDRIWATCQAKPDDCESATRDFVAKVVRTVRTRAQPASPQKVVAVLRPRVYVDNVGGPTAPDNVIDPFVDDLYVVYLTDLADSMRSLTPGEMAALGLDRRDLPALSVANLEARLGHLADALATAKPGDFAVLRSGNVLESSRLLMTPEWTALAASTGKAIVVAAPAGDVLLVAVGPTAEQLDKLRAMARGMFASAPRPVSPRLFRWTKGQWAVLS